MLLTTLACTLALMACGGGAGEGAALEDDQRRLPSRMPAADAVVAASIGAAPPASAVPAAAAASAATPAAPPAGDASNPTAAVAAAAALKTLSDAVGDPDAFTRALAPTERCQLGFVPPADLAQRGAAAPPARGGVFFTAAELATWRERTAAGPFIADNDFAPGSPGDWNRISANARAFAAIGEPTAPDDDAARAAHGQLARDAAFAHLIAPQAKLLDAVRGYLLREARAGQNDFARTRCLRAADGSARDGWFAEAAWLARYIATYDFVRAALAEGDRAAIDGYVRRNAWFFAAHMDHFLAYVFPGRLQGDYSRRGRDAASTGAAVWWSSQVDTNRDCDIDGRDDAAAYPAYAYVRSDGSFGPRLSVLTQWFNNRRSAQALAIAAAGVLLGESELTARAKRYVMEWLTYSVFADGSSGEYARNGDYCIARQGTVYNALNLQAGLMSARILARQGDRSLADFDTRDGLFGTESGAGGAAKSLALAADAYVRIATREIDWYQAEPQLARQLPREATSLSRMEVRFMGSTSAMDDFHELGLLASAAVVPGVAVAPLLLREGNAKGLRWPGSTGASVATGYGTWTDGWGTLPAAYLLRP
jgi:hypothetical protein